MDQLFKIKDSVWEYFSPSKNRRRSLAPKTPTPNNRTNMNKPYNFEAALTEPKDKKAGAVLAGRVSKKYLSPGDTLLGSVRKGKNIAKVPHRNDFDSDSDFECDNDDELDVDEEVDADEEIHVKVPSKRSPAKSPGSSRQSSGSPPRKTKPLAKYSSDEDSDGSLLEEELDYEKKDAERLAQETRNSYLAQRDEAMKKNEEEFLRIREQNWHPEEIAMFEKLAMRGYEPLMPKSWLHTFRTCPDILFSDEEDEIFIDAISGNEFRATNALESLMSLGARVRALAQVQKPAEFVMKKEFDNYIRWTEKDGGYASKAFEPLITVVARNPNKDPDFAITTKEIIVKMNASAKFYREGLLLPEPHEVNEAGEKQMYSAPVPVIFGIITNRTSAIVVTLDAAVIDGRDPKTMVKINCAENFMDVWNGIAIAILCITIRNRTIGLLEHMGIGSEEEETEEDVDA